MVNWMSSVRTMYSQTFFQSERFPFLYRKVIVGNYEPIPPSYSTELSDLIRMCLTVDDELRPDAVDLL